MRKDREYWKMAKTTTKSNFLNLQLDIRLESFGITF